jgi:hypothetical protein
MYKLRAGVAAFVTLLILTPGIVLAKNYCIRGFTNTSWVYVGQGFTVPGKGNCEPWTGFVAGQSSNIPAEGIGCTSSNGSNLSLTLTTGSKAGGFVEIDAISLSLPSQTGGYVSQILESNTVTSFGPDSGITGGACSTKTIPAVTEGEAAPPRPSSVR